MDYRDSMQVLVQALNNSVDEATHLDSVAGDGDLGLTLGRIAEGISSALESSDAPPPEHLKVVGLAIAKAAPSTFGTLVATSFLRASAAIDPAADPQVQIHQGLAAAEKAISERGKSQRGERTVLDSLGPAVDAFANSENLQSAWINAAEGATAGAASTMEIVPKHGRAAWVGERAQGNADAGATSFALCFSAVALANAAD